MNSRIRAAALLSVLTVVAACASTEVTQQTPPPSAATVAQQGMTRPSRIWVYDFAGSPQDVPADAAIATKVAAPAKPMNAEQAATASKLGALIAQDLIENINEMGLTAVRAGPGSRPQVGDGVIRGYLVSVEGGSGVKRYIIGFGSGKAELNTVVEGSVMTPQGLRRLGSGTLSSTGGKTPGTVMPAAVAIATGSPVGLIVVGGAKLYGEATGRSGIEGRAKATADEIGEQLKIRFQDRGWIE